jgi:hypothetical protein
MKKPATGPSDGIKANLISGGIFDISLDNFKEKQRWKCPFDVGAEGGTRTPTVLQPPAPQAGASANSATSAWEAI